MLNKEAKVTLFAVVSVAILVGVLWYHERSLDRMRELGIDPLARGLGKNDADRPQLVIRTPNFTPRPDDTHPVPDAKSPDDVRPVPPPPPITDFEETTTTPPPPPPVDSHQRRIHEVRPGETLWDISQKYFGDGDQADAIYELNRDVMDGPDNLVAGLRLRIPRKEDLEDTPDQPVQPAAVVHMVEPGENLWSISRKYFGDARHRTEIFEANRDKLTDPAHVVIGTELTIPKTEPKAPDTPAAPDPVPPAPPVPQDPVPSAPRRIIHVVQPGENLWSISRDYFGDASHHNEIFEANRDKLTDPARIPVGIKLVIPPNVDNATPPPSRPSVARPALRKHTVKPGDTLERIARRYYNNGAMQDRIIKANRNTLRNPNLVKTGLVLIIPED